jgi:hypothetical protein
MRDIRVIHRRLRVVRRQNLVLAPVAILAIRRRRVPCFHRLRVIAVRISLLCIRMALRAGHLLRRRIVRQGFHIRVTVHAPEHSAVNRMLELRAIDKQAHLLAVHVLRQRFVGVALKAVFVLQLVFAFVEQLQPISVTATIPIKNLLLSRLPNLFSPDMLASCALGKVL